MRVAAGRAMTWPRRRGCVSFGSVGSGAPGFGPSQSSSVPSPSRTMKISSSAEWQCGGPPSSCGGAPIQFSPDCFAPAAAAAYLTMPPYSPSIASRLTIDSGRADGAGHSRPCSRSNGFAP